MTLMIQARHLFYGISMLDKYKGTGRKKPYLIFGLCDETFSINCTADIPGDVDRGWFYFFVTLLSHFYWFSGATIGGIAGSLLQFNTEGLDFVMTAMFVVIFLEQWLKEKRHVSQWASLAEAAGTGNGGKRGMTLTEQLITVAMYVLGTMLSRFLPFAVFRSNRPTPRFIQYLGKVLPGAIFAMLVVYCLWNVSLMQGSHGLPELIAIVVTAELHLWKRQMLLSIAGGTVCYMLLVQFLF